MAHASQRKADSSIDMLHGSIADKLFYFAMPIGLIGFFAQLFNSTDIFILGHFVGKDAMAGVGNNLPVVGLFVTFLMGVSLGANVVIAQYLGARQYDHVGKVVQTSIIFSVVLGIVLTILGEMAVHPLLAVLGVPADVYDTAAVYLRIYLLSLPFLSLYNFEAAIFRSCGDGKTPLYSLILANVVNIGFDLASVCIFDWGITGVAWATVISFAVNSGVLFVLLCRTRDRIRLRLHHVQFVKDELRRIIHIGLPAGIQGIVFALSNLFIQMTINGLGTEAMAASAVGAIIEFNIYCFVNGFSQATTTFVGQNYGARNLPRCTRIMNVSFFVEAAYLFVVTVPILFFADTIVSYFNQDPTVIALTKIRIYIVSTTLYLNGIIDIIAGTLRGYGCSLPPMFVALIGICGFRIAWIFTIFVLWPTYAVLMVAYPASWLFTTLAIIPVYRSYHRRIVRDFQPAA